MINVLNPENFADNITGDNAACFKIEQFPCCLNIQNEFKWVIYMCYCLREWRSFKGWCIM
jgi:hypothetical protein